MNSTGNYIALDLETDVTPDEFTAIPDLEGLRKIPSYIENENIINLLVQMNFSLRAAMLCAQITGSNDLNTVLDFITSDDHGFYNHPYLEHETTRVCIICSDNQSKHLDRLDPSQFEQGD